MKKKKGRTLKNGRKVQIDVKRKKRKVREKYVEREEREESSEKSMYREERKIKECLPKNLRLVLC